MPYFKAIYWNWTMVAIYWTQFWDWLSDYRYQVLHTSTAQSSEGKLSHQFGCLPNIVDDQNSSKISNSWRSPTHSTHDLFSFRGTPMAFGSMEGRTPPRMNCWRSSRKPKGHRQGETHGDPPHFLMDDLAISQRTWQKYAKIGVSPIFRQTPKLVQSFLTFEKDIEVFSFRELVSSFDRILHEAKKRSTPKGDHLSNGLKKAVHRFFPQNRRNSIGKMMGIGVYHGF